MLQLPHLKGVLPIKRQTAELHIPKLLLGNRLPQKTGLHNVFNQERENPIMLEKYPEKGEA